MKKIEKILTTLTKINPKKDESRQDYLVRLVTAVEETVSDKKYYEVKAASPEVTNWVEGAIKEIDKDKPVSEFPDTDITNAVKPKEEVMKTSKTAGTAAKTVTPKRVVKKVAAKSTTKAKAAHLKVAKPATAAAKAVKKQVAKKVKMARVYKKSTLPTTVTSAIRQLVLQNQGCSKAEIGEKLTKAGLKYNKTTLSVTYSASSEMVEMQKQLGITVSK